MPEMPDAPARTGFLEESPGVRSMSRLAIAGLLTLAAPVVVTACVYTLRSPKPDATVLGALAGILAALVLNGVVALAKRGGGDTGGAP